MEMREKKKVEVVVFLESEPSLSAKGFVARIHEITADSKTQASELFDLLQTALLCEQKHTACGYCYNSKPTSFVDGGLGLVIGDSYRVTDAAEPSNYTCTQLTSLLTRQAFVDRLRDILAEQYGDEYELSLSYMFGERLTLELELGDKRLELSRYEFEQRPRYRQMIVIGAIVATAAFLAMVASALAGLPKVAGFSLTVWLPLLVVMLFGFTYIEAKEERLNGELDDIGSALAEYNDWHSHLHPPKTLWSRVGYLFLLSFSWYNLNNEDCSGMGKSLRVGWF